MAIVRIKKEKNYTVVDNGYLNDPRLSAREMGLLTKVLSLPDDWEFSIRGLEHILKDGQDGIRSALRVLEETGYLVRKRARNEYGKLGKIKYTFLSGQHALIPRLWKNQIWKNQIRRNQIWGRNHN